MKINASILQQEIYPKNKAKSGESLTRSFMFSNFQLVRVKVIFVLSQRILSNTFFLENDTIGLHRIIDGKLMRSKARGGQ